MSERLEFWPHENVNDDQFRFGHVMELRARIALALIERYGSIAATDGGEDSSGRAKAALQEPAALVERCFRIAELFTEGAIHRGFLRQPTKTIEEVTLASGKLTALRHEEETRRWRIPSEKT